jgi:2-oxoisovalerate dehydrogenase E1 component
MLDGAWARRPYPGDEFVIPYGVARRVRAGRELTLVTWGAMVERCEQAAAESAVDVDLLDLRTLVPWDREAVLASVAATGRCLIVHEDNMTAGFGAEIAAQLAHEAFDALDAPVERLALPDIPVPHNPVLLESVLPAVSSMVEAIRRIASY